MILSFMILALALSNPVTVTAHVDNHSSERAFNYLVTIVMENHGLSDILGNPDAPFMNALASTYALASNYTAVDHPSLPNYLALVSGQDFLTWSKSDCGPAPGCNAGSSQNLVDRLDDRGLTWKAYMEGYPSNCGTECSPGNCFLGDSGLYAARHDPFVYFADIANSTERCSHIVAANSSSTGGPDDRLLADLSSPSTASNFMWLTPNLCNDMHDCTVSAGDNYLSNLVPKILSSSLFTHQKAALFITFDEGNAAFPNDFVFSVWAGSVVKSNFNSVENHSHYSFLSTLERAWNLDPLPLNDHVAQPMLEFFTHVVHGHHGDLEAGDGRHEGGNDDLGLRVSHVAHDSE